jgi:NADH-quinone oxidoreductase subunit J
MIETGLFLFFAGCSIISSGMVISVKNPVHSVLFLILVFLNASGLLFLLEVEFFSLMFIVVYVGAIAVLFLFVVMMLDIKITDSNKSSNRFKYFPVASLLGLILFSEIISVIIRNFESNPLFHDRERALKAWYVTGLESDTGNSFVIYEENLYGLVSLNDIEVLGQILYTYCFIYFLIAGIILLVAMIGAIVLTLKFNKTSKVQTISKQLARNFVNSIFVVSSKT